MKSFGERAAIVTAPGCLQFLLVGPGAPLSVIRDRADMFTCAGAADFTITVSP